MNVANNWLALAKSIAEAWVVVPPSARLAVVLDVRGLTLPKEDQFGMNLADIRLQVRAGEIVGIAGVSGNGQQELMAAVSGEDTRSPPDSIHLFGKDTARAPAHWRLAENSPRSFRDAAKRRARNPETSRLAAFLDSGFALTRAPE